MSLPSDSLGEFKLILVWETIFIHYILDYLGRYIDSIVRNRLIFPKFIILIVATVYGFASETV
ncbi:hypothetical protein ASF26_13185 [Methylobacterium sp. Leaf93]|nr:hypothetical protein ASF26_13185 [Methylobacterium sp. Leaf93]